MNSTIVVKAKFGDSIRSKTDVAMTNECLTKLLAHNVCCLISAIYELGITPVFWKEDESQDEADGADILPMVRSS